MFKFQKLHSVKAETLCPNRYQQRQQLQQQFLLHEQYQHHFKNSQNQGALYNRDYYHRSQPEPVSSTGNVSWVECLTCGAAMYYPGNSSSFLSSMSPEDKHAMEIEYNRRRFRQHLKNSLDLAIRDMLKGRMTFLQAMVHYGLPRAALRKKAYELLQPK